MTISWYASSGTYCMFEGVLMVWPGGCISLESMQRLPTLSIEGCKYTQNAYQCLHPNIYKHTYCTSCFRTAFLGLRCGDMPGHAWVSAWKYCWTYEPTVNSTFLVWIGANSPSQHNLDLSRQNAWAPILQACTHYVLVPFSQ